MKRLGLALVLGGAICLSACDKYNFVSTFQQIGARVENLEDKELGMNEAIAKIKTIVEKVESSGYITELKKNADGSCVITFSDGEQVKLRPGRNGQDGQDGKDGKGNDLKIGVLKGLDGLYYWSLDGKVLLDENGDPLRVSALDGRDGQDGLDGRDGKDGKSAQVTMPQMRINRDTRNWEISTDGGKTWEDTGFCADGKDGTDGRNGIDGRDGIDGKDGAPDIISGVETINNGSMAVLHFIDGSSVTVPIF